MEQEIRHLEEVAERLARDHLALRQAYAAVQQRVAQAEAENAALRDKLAQAVARLERLVERLPQDA